MQPHPARRPPWFCTGAALTLLASSLPRPVQAQAADPRVAQARTACVAGDVAKGTRLLAELYTETNQPMWLFNQGRCFQQNAMAEQALARFKEFQRKMSDATPEVIQASESASRQAKQYINELQAELARKSAPAPTPTPAPAASPGLSRLDLVSLGLGGVGVLALGAGVYFSFQTRSAQTHADGLVDPKGHPDAKDVTASQTDGQRQQKWQWISYAVAAASGATGAALYIWGHKGHSAEPKSGVALAPVYVPGGVGTALTGRF